MFAIGNSFAFYSFVPRGREGLIPPNEETVLENGGQRFEGRQWKMYHLPVYLASEAEVKGKGRCEFCMY